MSMQWFGDEIVRNVEKATQAGVKRAAEMVLTKSKKVVPVAPDGGTLLRSGTVSTDGTLATISYDTPYALRQHEELGYRHAEGKTAKYLEHPLEENSDAAVRVIADAIRKALGG